MATRATSSLAPTLLLWALSFFAVHRALIASAQSLPPPRYDGFVYTKHGVDSGSIVIETFLDPVCPDSRDSWPPLKQAIDYYGPRVWLVVHLLPLPYHDNAYVASRALNIVNMLNTSATFPLLELFFKEQGIAVSDI
ncbi:RING-type domain-containing protein [Psidium guajava]|nr:RING-type domain-containing protein [Psidium guajava]